MGWLFYFLGAATAPEVFPVALWVSILLKLLGTLLRRKTSPYDAPVQIWLCFAAFLPMLVIYDRVSARIVKHILTRTVFDLKIMSCSSS